MAPRTLLHLHLYLSIVLSDCFLFKRPIDSFICSGIKASENESYQWKNNIAEERPCKASPSHIHKLNYFPPPSTWSHLLRQECDDGFHFTPRFSYPDAHWEKIIKKSPYEQQQCNEDWVVLWAEQLVGKTDNPLTIVHTKTFFSFPLVWHHHTH